MLKRKIIFKGLPNYTLKSDDMVSASDVGVLLGVVDELPGEIYGLYAHKKEISPITHIYVFPDDVVRKVKIKH